MNIALLSKSFKVRKIRLEDLNEVLSLCLENPLYYHHCPPLPSFETLKEDISKLPPNKTKNDKYYIGFYKNSNLIAVMDLILAYPDANTVFLGFFMVKKEIQNQGFGRLIIQEAFSYLSTMFKNIRLGYVLGNPQSEAFWLNQGFTKTGIIVREKLYSIVILTKELGGETDGN